MNKQGKPKARRSAPASNEVVVIKRDSANASDIGERMKSGALILFAGVAAAGTVYFYGTELRTLIEELLTWAATRIATLL